MTDLNSDSVFVGRIALAGLLAYVVGWERASRGSPAGDRTHAMVGIASAAFASIAIDKFPADAGRIIQGIITGVGFLGAGMIVKESGVDSKGVKGLTTAAGIWAVSSIGVMIGIGEYIMGVSLTCLIVLVLVKDRLPILRRLGYRGESTGGTPETDVGRSHDDANEL